MSSPTGGPSPRRAERPAGGDSEQSTAGQAKGAAADVADHGQQAAADVARTGQQAAGQVAGEAKERASDLLGQTRTQLREQAESQRANAVQILHDLGQQLAAMTADVDAHGAAVDTVSAARDRVQGAADWLDQRDGDQVLDEVRHFGRQRPGAFLLTAALAGVAAGRLTRGVVAEHTSSDATEADNHPTGRVANASRSTQGHSGE